MELKKDKLLIRIFENRRIMGKQAAQDIATCIRSLLVEKECINIIFAAAPSQLETLHLLVNLPGIDWHRVNAFHMDEYVGAGLGDTYSFTTFLKEQLFERVSFRSVFYLNGKAVDLSGECQRYAALLEQYPVDIVCLGIGENGHIAFNDPHVANFEDQEKVKIVELDEKCRMQQVHDGCFSSLKEVPNQALTLTIPSLISAQYMFCMVPSKAKAKAVYDTINGPISEFCPASILRTKKNAVLYLDLDSADLLTK